MGTERLRCALRCGSILRRMLATAEVLFEHVPPLWFIGAAVLLALIVTAWGLARCLPREIMTVVLGVLRVAFLLLLGWCLLLPVLKKPLTEVIRPRFAVALDASASMTLSAAKDGTNRWAVAQDALFAGWHKSLPENCLVEVFPFAADVGAPLALYQAGRLAPDGPSTQLHAALRKIADRYKGQNLIGVLLLSDGLDTRESADDWARESWPCPLVTVQLEPVLAWETEPDVRVDTVNTPRRVVAGWDTKLAAVVSGQGLKGELLNVQLLENGRVVQEAPTQIAAEGAGREVTFRLTHPEVGSFNYEVRIPPLRGETHTNDNSFMVTVQVVDTKNRLLYLEGVPRWESKYLIRVLRANRNVTPLCFVRGPGNQFLTYGERESMTLDLTDDQLSRFKIVILGNLDAKALDAARSASLARFVENGGSLVLLGGTDAWGAEGFPATEMRKVLPVQRDWAVPAEQGRFALQLTDEGRAHPVFITASNLLTGLPPVLTVFPGSTAAAGASVLIRAQTPQASQPVLVTQRYGQGKVVAILTDSLWRWQLDLEAAKPYPQFWNQLLQWLSPSEEEVSPYELDLFGDTDQLYMGETIRVNARLGGTGPDVNAVNAVTCEVESPDGRKVPLSMAAQNINTASGRNLPGFSAEYQPQGAGLYRAVARVQVGDRTVASPVYSFFVKPYTPESNPRPANAELLRTLAETSGGKCCQPQELNAAIAALKAPVREEERVAFTTLWNRIPILACLLALLAIEWVIRRARNMA